MKYEYIYKEDYIIIRIYSKKLKNTFDVLLDYCDEYLLQYHWYIKINEKNYIKANAIIDGKDRTMSNIILKKKKGYTIDHINRNSLDNRRSNLRYVSNSVNNKNRKFKNNKVNFTGVQETELYFKVSWYEKGKRKFKLIKKKDSPSRKMALKTAIRYRYEKGIQNEYTFSDEEKELVKIRIRIKKLVI